jgi:hypothetical protein
LISHTRTYREWRMRDCVRLLRLPSLSTSSARVCHSRHSLLRIEAPCAERPDSNSLVDCGGQPTSHSKRHAFLHAQPHGGATATKERRAVARPRTKEVASCVLHDGSGSGAMATSKETCARRQYRRSSWWSYAMRRVNSRRPANESSR